MASRYAVSLADFIAQSVPSCSSYAAAIADAVDAHGAAAIRDADADAGANANADAAARTDALDTD